MSSEFEKDYIKKIDELIVNYTSSIEDLVRTYDSFKDKESSIIKDRSTLRDLVTEVLRNAGLINFPK